MKFDLMPGFQAYGEAGFRRQPRPLQDMPTYGEPDGGLTQSKWAMREAMNCALSAPVGEARWARPNQPETRASVVTETRGLGLAYCEQGAYLAQSKWALGQTAGCVVSEYEGQSYIPGVASGKSPLGTEQPSLYSSTWDPTTWDPKEGPEEEEPDRETAPKYGERPESRHIPGDGLAPNDGPVAGSKTDNEEPLLYGANGEYGEFKVRGQALGRLEGADRTIQAFMVRHGVPNAALAAIDGKGRLCLSKGYTLTAISDVETEPTSMFRLASLTKTLTAIGILKLYEQGAFPNGLRTLAREYLPILDSGIGGPGVAKISVKRLLSHTSGIYTLYDRDLEFLAAKAYNTTGRPPANKQDVVRYIFEYNNEPTFQSVREGGTLWHYSGMNYIMLGMIIEAVTGMKYWQYIESILRRFGILRTRKAYNMKADRYRQEVTYFTMHSASGCPAGHATPISGPWCGAPFVSCVPWPYGGMNLDNSSSSAGLVSTTHDLLRVGLELRGRSGGSLLLPQTADLMFSDQTGGQHPDHRSQL